MFQDSASWVSFENPVLNTARISAQAGLSLAQCRGNLAFRGRLVESAIGAHLANAGSASDRAVHYCRHRNREVDFVLRAGRTVVAIEVKSGRAPDALPGMAAAATASTSTLS